jgi:hypothetical protein
METQHMNCCATVLLRYYGNATGCIGHVTKENPICHNIYTNIDNATTINNNNNNNNNTGLYFCFSAGDGRPQAVNHETLPVLIIIDIEAERFI